jgi:DNA-directed RNA polymerase alpha subunit
MAVSVEISNEQAEQITIDYLVESVRCLDCLKSEGKEDALDAETREALIKVLEYHTTPNQFAALNLPKTCTCECSCGAAD